MKPPLFLTADRTLLDELTRLAAAAGITPDVSTDPASALGAWAAAPLVLVGADLADAVAAIGPERRPGVHVLTPGPPPEGVYRTAVVIGADAVTELPRSEGWVVETLTDLGEVGRRRGHVVGVVAGSGGAGATTLACALGQVAARSGDAVVVDCDPLGPGVDRVLGLDTVDGFRWDALCRTTGRLGSRSLREALPRRRRLGALSWHAGATGTLQAFAAREVLSAARRGHDHVVLDLPRSTDPLVAELAARCDLLLVVTVASVPGLASATRVCERLGDHPGLRLVVRGDGLETAGIASLVGAPVGAVVRDQRGLAESVDLGLGPVRSSRSRLGRVAEELLGLLEDVAPVAA